MSQGGGVTAVGQSPKRYQFFWELPLFLLTNISINTIILCPTFEVLGEEAKGDGQGEVVITNF